MAPCTHLFSACNVSVAQSHLSNGLPQLQFSNAPIEIRVDHMQQLLHNYPRRQFRAQGVAQHSLQFDCCDVPILVQVEKLEYFVDTVRESNCRLGDAHVQILIGSPPLEIQDAGLAHALATDRVYELAPQHRAEVLHK